MPDRPLELEKSLVLTALGEEFQMIDIYSSVRELCHNQKVMGVLEILIRESKGHASSVSEITLELASKHSLNLEEIDQRVSELAAKNPGFRLTGEAFQWYRDKVSGLSDSNMEDFIESHEITNKATITALDIFAGEEKIAYSLYHELSGILASGSHKAAVSKIASDELRHESLIRNLAIYLKGNKEPEPEPDPRQQTTVGMLYCVACLKIHKGDADECGACGNDLRKL